MNAIIPALAALAQSFPRPVVTRFAPSPTGYLHLGHVVNAIYVWGVARALDGIVLLRIEDHDRTRSRPRFEQALLDDLDWLGFVPDRGREPLVRQSKSPMVYEDALARLRGRYRVYACECSRKRLDGERYDGCCRGKGLPSADGFGLRVELDQHAEAFDDVLQGPMEQTPSAQCGDLLLKDRDGNWTYQFTVTVDDARQGVSLVVRGQDLLGSSGRQIKLARMLGRHRPPRFLHHPLILKANGEKLSKAARDTGIRELRESGLLPEHVIGRAAAAVGLLPDHARIKAVDVAALFSH